MEIHISISAIPARAEWARNLHDTFVGQDCITSVALRCDDPPSGSSWNNYRDALCSTANLKGWLVCLDDDVVLCNNAPAEIYRCLSYCPGDVANLMYSLSTANVQKALRADAYWVRTPYFVQGAGFAIRTHLAHKIPEWAAKNTPADFQSGDQRLMMYMAYHGIYTYCAVPSLVDHRHDNLSAIWPNAREGTRRAIWFQRDISGVKWNSRHTDGFSDSAFRFLKAQKRRKTLLCDLPEKTPHSSR